MKPDQIAELHHLHHSQYTEDIPFWIALAEQHGGAVLELGCGTGRVLLALADAGIDVVGVDHDAVMLGVLRRQLAAQPRDHAAVIEGDFTEVTLPGPFPLIIMPCNTYTTLDAAVRGRLLARLPALLTPSGVLVASMPNPALLASLEAESEPEMEQALEVPGKDATLSVSSGWAHEGDWLRFDWVYDLMRADGLVERGGVSTRHELTAWATLRAELQAAGFEVEVWGDYTGKPFDEDEDANLVLHLEQTAQKR